jgi:predicted permease
MNFDSLRADVVFGWRQMLKKKVTSAATILSLALAMGACLAAFRLIDAMLLRPLPIKAPERLYLLSKGQMGSFGYRDFLQLRESVKDQAELVGISSVQRMDLTYRPADGFDGEMEKANVQYVSGWMFASFGIQPASGRLFSENEDLSLRAHPVAVLSYDYWTRRFGRDPGVIGRTVLIGRRFGVGNDLFEIVGITGEKFTGTEPGTVTEVFAPSTMSALMPRPEASWLQAYIHLRPAIRIDPVREHLNAAYRAMRGKDALTIEPAPGGVSRMQADYRVPLLALGVLVALVLLIACANAANLSTASAAARAREMALRVSLGAGRSRLMQLVLAESALVALAATGAAALFAWWSAPFVTARIHPADNPARLVLSIDWQVLGFGLLLTLGVTLLCGLPAAWRAARVDPAGAIKGDRNPHARSRTMYAMIALQVALCFVVLFVGGLFTVTFDRLANQSKGFSAERILNVDVVAERAQSAAFWDQMTERLKTMPGVEKAVLADWPLLDGYGFRFNELSINGGPPSDFSAAFMFVSPGWIGTMGIPLKAGRDLDAADASPGSAIVNEEFAKEFFHGKNPIGKSFEGTSAYMKGQQFQIVGLVGNVRYRLMRQPVLPVAYTPFHRIDGAGALRDIVEGTFVLRTAGTSSSALAAAVREEVPRLRPGFRVSNVRTEQGLIDAQTVRERLLAVLAAFFSGVALLLAGVGLYGVLEYSVTARRREIGIRMALGARAPDVARRVTVGVFSMVAIGAAVGVAGGMASVRYIEALLYEVKGTELSAIVWPAAAIVVAASVAAVPALVHALHLDPARLLRTE